LNKPPNGLRSRTCPAGCGAGAGVDSAWEQEKLEARKNAAKSPAFNAPRKSGAHFSHFVGCFVEN